MIEKKEKKRKERRQRNHSITTTRIIFNLEGNYIFVYNPIPIAFFFSQHNSDYQMNKTQLMKALFASDLKLYIIDIFLYSTVKTQILGSEFRYAATGHLPAEGEYKCCGWSPQQDLYRRPGTWSFLSTSTQLFQGLVASRGVQNQ